MFFHIQFLLDISPALRYSLMLPLPIFKFAEIGWYTVSYSSVQMGSTTSKEDKVSKLLRAAFILNVGYNCLYSMLGNITCERWWAACSSWGKWIYDILSSVLSHQFYIIAYALDKISNIFGFISICMLLWLVYCWVRGVYFQPHRGVYCWVRGVYLAIHNCSTEKRKNFVFAMEWPIQPSPH